jgi:cell division protein FtsL
MDKMTIEVGQILTVAMGLIFTLLSYFVKKQIKSLEDAIKELNQSNKETNNTLINLNQSNLIFNEHITGIQSKIESIHGQLDDHSEKITALERFKLLVEIKHNGLHPGNELGHA